jgi:hypothetical protein
MSIHNATEPGDPRHTFNELKRLRDEIRLRIHLGEMDARKAWQKLEPRIDRLDRRLDAAGKRVTVELRAALRQAKKSIQALRDRL